MKRLLWTGFGLGLLPRAPGSFGTLLGLPLAWGIGSAWGVALAAAAVALLAVPLARDAERREGRGDPPSFVLDEVAGYLVAMIALPLDWPHLLGGYAAFRLFDIAKPWPIRALERIPRGWGVVVDDLMAGLYANLLLRLLLLL